jgi:hypothetical protein
MGQRRVRVLVRVEQQPAADDAATLRRRNRTRMSESSVMYGLVRDAQWICAPDGDGDPVPPVITAESSRDNAWLATNLEQAIERQPLLRMAFGLATEVRAVR